MAYLADVMVEMLPALEAALKRAVSEPLQPCSFALQEMLGYHLGWEGKGAGGEAQGKRIRPLLTLLCAQACGADWQTALPAATAVELLHNFSLIHDDIQDRSPLRRGRPAVWRKWGVAQAINAGDVMFTLSFAALQGLAETVGAPETLEAQRVFQEVCLALTDGQYMDMAYEQRNDLSLEEYWPMIRGKTSALLGGCAELGALAGGAGSDRRRAFREYGLRLGLAFQVIDDWLGIWGDAAQTGKSTDSDLVSGKKSLPVLFGLAKDSVFRQRWLRGGVRAEDLPEMVAMLRQCGAEAFTLDEAARLTGEARAALQQAAPEGRAAAALDELTDSLLKRQK
jgi:geranylgeranyl diphosphate synthase type I